MSAQLLMQDLHDSARVPRSNAGWRNVIGEIGEQVAAQRLDAQRISVGAQDKVSPDLKSAHTYFEVKTSGRSRAVLIYAVRLEKERWFSHRFPLCYAIVEHDAALPLASIRAAREIMLSARVLVVPFRVIEGLCQLKTPRILNKHYKASNGWCQRGYELGGYSLRVSDIKPHAIIL